MNSQILVVAQIVVDVFLLLCIVYLVLSISKKNRVSEEGRIKALFNTLDKRINAANTALDKISLESERGFNTSKDLMRMLEGKRVELQGYLERIDNVLKALDEALPPKGTETAHFDRYKEASKLAEQGHSIDEIVKRVGLPKGEVQLIVGLKKK